MKKLVFALGIAVLALALTDVAQAAPASFTPWRNPNYGNQHYTAPVYSRPVMSIPIYNYSGPVAQYTGRSYNYYQTPTPYGYNTTTMKGPQWGPRR
jgi:hypothetical protein